MSKKAGMVYAYYNFTTGDKVVSTTIKEIADMLDVHRNTIKNWLQSSDVKQMDNWILFRTELTVHERRFFKKSIDELQNIA